MSEHKRVEEPLEPQLDLSQLTTSYANWYQVTGTPEEMIIDFGITANLGVITGEVAGSVTPFNKVFAAPSWFAAVTTIGSV